MGTITRSQSSSQHPTSRKPDPRLGLFRPRCGAAVLLLIDPDLRLIYDLLQAGLLLSLQSSPPLLKTSSVATYCSHFCLLSPVRRARLFSTGDPSCELIRFRSASCCF